MIPVGKKIMDEAMRMCSQALFTRPWAQVLCWDVKIGAVYDVYESVHSNIAREMKIVITQMLEW